MHSYETVTQAIADLNPSTEDRGIRNVCDRQKREYQYLLLQ